MFVYGPNPKFLTQTFGCGCWFSFSVQEVATMELEKKAAELHLHMNHG